MGLLSGKGFVLRRLDERVTEKEREVMRVPRGLIWGRARRGGEWERVQKSTILKSEDRNRTHDTGLSELQRRNVKSCKL